MTYQEALKYLESFINYEKVDSYNYKSYLKLERMKRFSALLGDPQKHTKSIHIAGTKGKGSTAVYVYSILKAAGFKVGLYTSPHLVDFRERIRINDPSALRQPAPSAVEGAQGQVLKHSRRTAGSGSSRAVRQAHDASNGAEQCRGTKSRDGELIGEYDLSRILEGIKDTVERFMKDDRPSFFEVYTALAYLYFKEKKCDFAVYEVGLGGRLDATNILEPLVCAITPLSYEHTDKLGCTLEEIAAEKCGIIKSNSICVSAPQSKTALETIERICAERNSRLILVGKNIKFEEIRADDSEEVFSVFGILGEYPIIRSRLIGSHQMVNAALAIGIIEALSFRGITIPMDAVRNGIEDARWEGRLEIVSRSPTVVLDGAQNGSSANVLANAIKKIFRYKRLILVFGVSKDKDVKGMLEELLPLADSLILTKAKITDRALEPEEIKKIIGTDTLFPNIQRAEIGYLSLFSSVEDALAAARSKAGPDDLILITGSLFVVGEAKEALAKCPDFSPGLYKSPSAVSGRGC